MSCIVRWMIVMSEIFQIVLICLFGLFLQVLMGLVFAVSGLVFAKLLFPYFFGV